MFPVVAAVVTVVLYGAWLARLPDHLASHFGPGGRADDFVATSAFPFVLPGLALGLAVLFGGLSWVIRSNPEGQRMLSLAGGAAGTLLLVANVLILHANLDVTDPTTVVFPGWTLGAMGAALVVGSAAGWLATGQIPPVDVEPPAEAEPTTSLARGESASWHRTVFSPATLWIMLLLVPITAIIGVASSWWSLAIFLPVYVLLAAFARVHVAIDDDGLTIRMLGGWPRFRFPVTQIRSARSRTITVMRDFGGWGWRTNRRATGLILRSGPGLWIYRNQKAPFAITVPDADNAAALLNAVRDRHHNP